MTLLTIFDGTGGTGNFPNDNSFLGGFRDYFALHAVCKLEILATGDDTFGTSNDDGVRLKIGTSPVIEEDDDIHGVKEFYKTEYLAAGSYDLDLVFFERDGGASVELFAARGNCTSFDSSMRLTGDTANGVLACNYSAPAPTLPTGRAVPVLNNWSLIILTLLMSFGFFKYRKLRIR